MTKEYKLSEVYEKYSSEFEGNEFVFGCGFPEPKVVLVGEAPGREEVKLSRPFSGAAGRNLDEFLALAGINRDDIYITNAIKYRLSKVNPKTGRLSNRPATKDEIMSSRIYLIREIEILRPKWVVTMGNVPLRAVTGDFSLNIGEYHGRAICVNVGKHQCMLFPLYHPASVIYNRSLKEVCEADIIELGRLTAL
jgi:uracil-DNA glycosylase family 4